MRVFNHTFVIAVTGTWAIYLAMLMLMHLMGWF